MQDEPGKKTFVDTTVSHSGKASLRIENFGQTANSNAGKPAAPRQMLQALKTRTRGAWREYPRRFA